MDDRSFRGVVFVGPKDTYALGVPFDPAVEWPDHAAVRLSTDDDPRGGRGWSVVGTIAGATFEGFVGRRYGRSYIVLSPRLRAETGLRSGDEVDVCVAPRRTAS
jgi:hypothetical protein